MKLWNWLFFVLFCFFSNYPVPSYFILPCILPHGHLKVYFVRGAISLGACVFSTSFLLLFPVPICLHSSFPRFHLQIGCLSSSSRIDDTKRNIVTLPCHSLPHFRDNKQCNGKNKYGFCVIMYLIQSVSNNSKVRCFWAFLSILIFRQRVQILLSPGALSLIFPLLLMYFWFPLHFKFLFDPLEM